MTDADPAASSRAGQRRRTEARILDAASRLFAVSGYERTTIRGIASAAGVDPGLIIHYFGSKQQLFQQVIQAGPARELTGTPGEVTEQILARLASEPGQSLAVLRSMLTHPEAAQAATEDVARFRDQISRSIPAGDATLRAELVTAIALGVTVSRYLLKSDGYANASPEQITDLLRPCLRSLTGADKVAPIDGFPGSRREP